MADLPDLMTTEEVAEYLKVSIEQVRIWIRNGDLQALRPSPRVTRIAPSALQAFIEGNNHAS